MHGKCKIKLLGLSQYKNRGKNLLKKKDRALNDLLNILNNE